MARPSAKRARLPGFVRPLLWLAAWAVAPPLPAVTVAISCGAVGQELELCREGAQAWSRRTGHAVEIVSMPNSATERLALYQQLLAGGAARIDVFQIDVVWPGILARNLIDLAPYLHGDQAAHFPALIENNTVDGRLVAVPFYTDAGVLFYRDDLLRKHGLPVPRSWQELTDTARRIQAAERAAGHRGLWGLVCQGRAYEGLTVNALEWLAGFDAGRVVEADGTISIDNPRAARALALAAGWIGDIVPEGVLNYAEEEARGVFQSGNAVFMRNWPYAWALANGADSPVRGKVGVAMLPGGGVLGGWNLAVSRHSRHPAEAADLVRYLAGRTEQKRRAVAAAYNPTLPGLYRDPEVLAANPFLQALYPTFSQTVARPSRVTGYRYNRVSNAFWNAVHEVLAGRRSAAEALAELDDELRRLRRRGW